MSFGGVPRPGTAWVVEMRSISRQPTSCWKAFGILLGASPLSAKRSFVLCWGGLPAPLATPGFTWGGCHPPDVGLRPPHHIYVCFQDLGTYTYVSKTVETYEILNVFLHRLVLEIHLPFSLPVSPSFASCRLPFLGVFHCSFPCVCLIAK